MNDWVKLNIGGVVYHTTRSTLMKDGNSMICKMFAHDGLNTIAPSIKDETGCYLIDR
jgi:hypothetical protein